MLQEEISGSVQGSIASIEGELNKLISLRSQGTKLVRKPRKTKRKQPRRTGFDPDSLIKEVTTLGTSHLIDGRVVELLTNQASLPEPIEMNTHPLRDVWVKVKGAWIQTEEAVAWEELKKMDKPIDPKAEACLVVYRRSTMDSRRHADAEAFMHREIEGIRNAGGRSSEELAPKGSDKDIGLVVSVPHSFFLGTSAISLTSLLLSRQVPVSTGQIMQRERGKVAVGTSRHRPGDMPSQHGTIEASGLTLTQRSKEAMSPETRRTQAKTLE